jgi:hypothetical protein
MRKKQRKSANTKNIMMSLSCKVMRP